MHPDRGVDGRCARDEGPAVRAGDRFAQRLGLGPVDARDVAIGALDYVDEQTYDVAGRELRLDVVRRLPAHDAGAVLRELERELRPPQRLCHEQLARDRARNEI